MRSLWLLAGVASAYTGLAAAAASFATHARPPAGRSLTRIRCFMPFPGSKPKRIKNTAAAKGMGCFPAFPSRRRWDTASPLAPPDLADGTYLR